MFIQNESFVIKCFSKGMLKRFWENLKKNQPTRLQFLNPWAFIDEFQGNFTTLENCNKVLKIILIRYLVYGEYI